ncbi:hypothetical protein M885DRAFT_495734 [Pelagophyceae sp. CCMP2097]|nr:hypothetical protein M885DRAFT_495734 [Pelagophyceae sp. CCMP2097]
MLRRAVGPHLGRLSGGGSQRAWIGPARAQPQRAFSAVDLSLTAVDWQLAAPFFNTGLILVSVAALGLHSFCHRSKNAKALAALEANTAADLQKLTDASAAELAQVHADVQADVSALHKRSQKLIKHLRVRVKAERDAETRALVEMEQRTTLALQAHALGAAAKDHGETKRAKSASVWRTPAHLIKGPIVR